MSPLYIGIIIAGVGLVLALGGFIVRRTASRLLAAPVFKTGDLVRANGAASVEGAVRAQQPLTSPCTNTPCVYYQVTIEKKVKEQRGGQTQTKWIKIVDQNVGSTFALDDGSGPAIIQAHEAIEGDLEQTFSGQPQGGLGSLAGLIPAATQRPGEHVLEYRVTEKVIRAGARLYALGAAHAGQLMKPGSGKLLFSTRGRDALLGSTKSKSMALLVAGGFAVVGGATMSIVRPGEARACGALVDNQKGCAISSEVVTVDRLQSDGTKKPETIRRKVLTWKVTKASKYELAASDPKKGRAMPTIQVENSIGMPMNIDMGIGIGAGAHSTKTTTAKLDPGDYTVYVFSSKDAPEKLVLQIHEVPTT